MTEHLLQVKGLKKHFRTKQGSVRAVDGVDFTIDHGETLGLVGESGSGKTTVGYTVIGLYVPTAGDIFFRGESIALPVVKRSKSTKKEMQIVFQNPGSSLNPRRKIEEIIVLPLRVHGTSDHRNNKQRVAELLGRVELSSDYASKAPTILSGGEQARVTIARALATDPKFIILDEPTAALDVSIQAKIITMLVDLQKELSLSYLFVSHDLSLMRNVADRVGIMYLGKICEVAPAAEFFQNPLHPYSQMLLSSIPVVSDEDEKLKPKKIRVVGEIPSPVDLPSGCSFHPRCPKKMNVCPQIDPEMAEVEEGHFVKCHLYAQAG